MIGILIVTHQGLAEAFAEGVWDLIVGRKEGHGGQKFPGPQAPPEVSRRQIHGLVPGEMAATG